MDNTKLVEYMKLHRLSLIQDNAYIVQDTESADWNFLQGQIIAVEHLLDVAEEL
jgi:hypothetical protein